MKIKDGYLMREIAGTFVVVPVGERVIDFKGMMTLTGIAPFIWSDLEKGTCLEDLCSRVIEEYDVEAEQAKLEINSLLDKMNRLGLIEE